MAEPIQEFLVQLGFKVDTNAQNKFRDGIKASAGLVNMLRRVLVGRSGTDEEGAEAAGVTTVDDAKGKGLVGALSLGMHVVKRFGEAYIAAGTSLAVAVVGIAASMSRLLFISQQSGTTVENIRALSFAFRQFGGTAEQAQNAAASLANFIRQGGTSAKNYVRSLGVNPNEDISQMTLDLGRHWRQMAQTGEAGYLQAQAQATRLGIDPSTFLILIRGVDQVAEHFKSVARGMDVDLNKAAVAGRFLTDKLNEARTSVDLLGDHVEQQFGKRMGDDVGTFTTFLQQHASIINAVTDGILGSFLTLGEGAGRALMSIAGFITDTLIPAFDQAAVTASNQGGSISKSLGDVATAAGQAGTAFAGLFSKQIGGETIGQYMVDGIVWIGNTIKDNLLYNLGLVKDGLAVIADLLQGKWSQAWKDWVNDMRGALDYIVLGPLKAIGDALDRLSVFAFGKPITQGSDQAPAGGPPGVKEATPLPADVGARADNLINYLTSKGIPLNEARGIVATQMTESSLTPAATNPSGATGLGQWLDRLPALKQFAAIRHENYLDPYVQEDFEIQELQGKEAKSGAMYAGARTPEDVGQAAFSYERPANPGTGAAEIYQRRTANYFRSLQNRPFTGHVVPPVAATAPPPPPPGIAPGYVDLSPKPADAGAGKVSMLNPSTNITITGVTDPRLAADLVRRSQDRVNANLLRNLNGMYA